MRKKHVFRVKKRSKTSKKREKKRSKTNEKNREKKGKRKKTPLLRAPPLDEKAQHIDNYGFCVVKVVTLAEHKSVFWGRGKSSRMRSKMDSGVPEFSIRLCLIVSELRNDYNYKNNYFLRMRIDYQYISTKKVIIK